MKRFLFLTPPFFVTVLIGLFLFLVLGAFSRAEAGTFQGTYFNDPDSNTHLSGTASQFTSSTSTIDFNWGTAGPQPNSGAAGYMNPTNFSARFSGWIDCPTTGYYTFETVADDGVQLFLDNSSTAVIPAWYAQSADIAHPNSGSIHLVQGAHRLRLEYFQSLAPHARISLRWKVPGYVAGDTPQPPLVPAADTPQQIWSLETALSGGGWLTPDGAGVSTGTIQIPLYLDESQKLPYSFAEVTDMDRWRQGAVETAVERSSCGYTL